MILAITVLAFITIVFNLWFIDAILSKMEMEEMLIGFFLNLCWCGVTIYIVCCCLILFTIRVRLFMVNKIARKSLKISEIKTVSKLHMKLCEIASKSSKIFSFQMAIMTGLSVVNGTLCIFELFIAVRDQAGRLQLFYGIMATVFCTFFSSLVGLIMGFSSLTANEGERTLAVLHTGIYGPRLRHDENRKRKFQILLLQLQHFNVNITCGFYRLELKVMMMVR